MCWDTEAFGDRRTQVRLAVRVRGVRVNAGTRPRAGVYLCAGRQERPSMPNAGLRPGYSSSIDVARTRSPMLISLLAWWITAAELLGKATTTTTRPTTCAGT